MVARIRPGDEVARIQLAEDHLADIRALDTRLKTIGAHIQLTDEPLTPGRTSIPAEPPEGVQAFIVLDWKYDRLVGIGILDASSRLHQDFLGQAEAIG